MPLDFCPLLLFLSMAPTFHTSRRAWWPFPIKHWFCEVIGAEKWVPHQSVLFSSVQSLSRVWLFVTPWTAARQASLSITSSLSLLKLISIKSVMLSSLLILCHPLLFPPSIFPNTRVFSNESAVHIRWPKYWSFSFHIALPMNIQDWFPLGWTDWISLQSKGLSRVFSNTTVQKHQFFGAQPILGSIMLF